MSKGVSSGKNSSRDRVLHLLESRKGSFFSGEEIAAELEISRTAVWKAVKRLRDEGFRIEAVTNRGYCLSQDTDILSEEKIRYYLDEILSEEEKQSGPGSMYVKQLVNDMNRSSAIRFYVTDTIDSTNAYCLQKAHAGEPGGLIAVAGKQTRGRGRRGRSFFSPQDTGLYMSIMTRPFGIDSRLAVRFTTIAAVAVAEAIEAVSGRTAEIKWVNDIFVGGRKVCGILTEASFNLEDSSLDYAVIGIGINVYEPEGGFPENIRSIAGAVQPIDPRDPSSNTVLRNGGRNRLAAEVLIRFYVYWFIEMKALSGPEFDPHATRYIDEYRRRCFVIGHEVEVHKAGSLPEPAYVRGVDDDCRLLVTYGDGREEALNSGEISIRF